MYSRDETVNAVHKFYQAILRQPYLNNSALILPPASGWENITTQGENETVLDLLRHLPYLRPEKAPSEQLLINWETIPICHQSCTPGDDFWNSMPAEIHPLPTHCVYLSRGVDGEGTNLILDPEGGTLTEYSHTGSRVEVSHDEYHGLPDAEKWRAHRTMPVGELLDAWTVSRAGLRYEEEELLGQQDGELRPWEEEDDVSDGGDDHDGESEIDRANREDRESERRHLVHVYNLYLRYGWPDHFGKEQCRAELLNLEKKKNEDDKRRMDELSARFGD